MIEIRYVLDKGILCFDPDKHTDQHTDEKAITVTCYSLCRISSKKRKSKNLAFTKNFYPEKRHLFNNKLNAGSFIPTWDIGQGGNVGSPNMEV